MRHIVKQLVPLLGEIVNCAKFWKEYQSKVERSLWSAAGSVSFTASVGVSLALIGATNDDALKASTSFAFQKNILFSLLDTMSVALARMKQQQLNATGVQVVTGRLTELCIVLREGIQCGMRLGRRMDQEQMAPMQSMETAFKLWALDILGKQFCSCAVLFSLLTICVFLLFC